MRTLALTLAILALASPVTAQQFTKDGSITMIRTGWNSDSFAVVTAEPIVNPKPCPYADGYVSEKSLPGYDTFYAAALTAYLANRPVTIAVDKTECVLGRPKLIGINLRK